MLEGDDLFSVFVVSLNSSSCCSYSAGNYISVCFNTLQHTHTIISVLPVASYTFSHVWQQLVYDILQRSVQPDRQKQQTRLSTFHSRRFITKN